MTTTDATTGEETFDPSSIPSFPIVNVRVRADDDGHMHGELDGQPIDVDDGDPITSLMAAAAKIAATRPMRAVRVSATDTSDTTWLMVVHADGRSWDLDTSDAPAESKRRLNAAGITNRTLALLAAGTLTVAAGGLGAAWALSSRDGQSVSTPTAAPAGEAPVVPVQGWARRAAWVSPELEQSDAENSVLSTKNSVIITLATDNGPALAALRSDDGATLWASPLPGSLTGAPQLSSYDGREAVVAATDSKLLLWPNSPGAAPSPTEWEFTEASVTLVPRSPVPVLANDDTNTALVLNGSRLEKRVVPAGAHVIRADDKGVVTAVDEVGHWWHLTNETTAPSPTMLQPPTYGAQVQEVLGVAGRTLIVSWSYGDDATMLAAYATENKMKPVWQTKITGKPTSNDFAVSPDGTWAIAGTTAVRAESGKTRALPEDWKTLGMTNDAAWAQDYVAKKLDHARKIDEPVDDPAGVPVATTDDGRGLIIANSDQTTRLYALEPDPGHPYDAGDTITPTAPSTTAKPKPKTDKKATKTSKKPSTAGSTTKSK
ncbi:hypothetical protein [Janibacter terrae]|uniref:hypothetical protein n=1 Tax=Janibacter terrae TaxID=103817 RepID=UPI0031F75D4C